MEFSSDIRWLQRFENFRRDLLALEQGVMLAQIDAVGSHSAGGGVSPVPGGEGH